MVTLLLKLGMLRACTNAGGVCEWNICVIVRQVRKSAFIRPDVEEVKFQKRTRGLDLGIIGPSLTLPALLIERMVLPGLLV